MQIMDENREESPEASKLPEKLRVKHFTDWPEEKQKHYVEELQGELSTLSDAEICRPKKMYVEYKLYALSLKYGRDIGKELSFRKGSFYFHDIKVYGLRTRSLFSVDVFAVDDGALRLSGRIWCPLADDMTFYLENDRGERFRVEARPAKFRRAVILGKEMIRVRGYEIALPLKASGGYSVYACYRDEEPYRLHPKFGKFAGVSREVPESYYHRGGYLIDYEEERARIRIVPDRAWIHLKKELCLLGRCVRDRKFEIAFYRILSRLVRPFLRRERWIVMERINVAGDNAECFYRFLKEHEDRDIWSCFIIHRECADYERMKKIGRVLPFRGFRHKLNLLLARKIISSQAEDNIYNPWDQDGVYIRDLYRYDYIFLQHGIILNDLSGWLNKFNKNLRMFVTSARPEYESIVDQDYFYDSSVVKLTGIPRYDDLKLDLTSEKTIVFMPTWRNVLAAPLDNDTGERAYNPAFRESEFYRFYQDLIQDERLLRVMRENGYTGKLILHPQQRVQAGDFTGNDVIRIAEGAVSYREEFEKNALLITDYSSVAFDFAYLGKPVIYAQFDADRFFEGQLYTSGYFDYERDGMGPVCCNYEETLQETIRCIRLGCNMEEKYRERRDRFYCWSDQDNCRRVYDAIRSLERKGE